MSNYYKTLGVLPGAAPADIKKAFRNLSLQLHPDKNRDANNTNSFAAIIEAYHVLSDPVKKYEYDLKLMNAASSHGEAIGQSTDDSTYDPYTNVSKVYGKSPYEVLRLILEDKPVIPKDTKCFEDEQFQAFRRFINDDSYRVFPVSGSQKSYAQQNGYSSQSQKRSSGVPSMKEWLQHKMAQQGQDKCARQMYNGSQSLHFASKKIHK